MKRRDFLKLTLGMPLLPLANSPWAQGSRGRHLSQRPDRPNVLVLVFDTLSAKHISLYDYPRETTPNLVRFAERATVYHAHYAAGNFTTPGTASLLTGTYPWSHRGLHLWGQVDRKWESRNLFRGFSSSGYARIAYTHNPLVSRLLDQFMPDLDEWKSSRDLELLYGEFSDLVFANDSDLAYLAEGRLFRPTYWRWHPSSLFLSLVDKVIRFTQRGKLEESLSTRFPLGVPNHNGSQFFLVEDVVDWIQALFSAPDQPFLAYVHLLPPHHPYNTRQEFVGRFEDGWTPGAKEPHFFSMGFRDGALNRMRREYDEYVAYVDAEFGRLYDSMVETGAIEDTILLVTSDHGEMFERGIFQHLTPTLYEPVIRVPLLASLPGQRTREDIHSATSCVDVLPTLLHLTQQPIPDWCEGQVLPPFQEASDQRGVFVVEAKSNAKSKPLRKATLAVVREQLKLIHYLGYDGMENNFELYDLRADPEELHDLYPSQPSLASSLKEVLQGELDASNQALR